MSADTIHLETIRASHEERLAASWLPPQATLPQLPETAAFEILERVIDAEQKLVAPTLQTTDYGVGTARYDDELLVIDGGGLLASAEHATIQVRQKKKTPGSFQKEPDYGTAGLAYILHQDIGAAAVIPKGRQTGDANNDSEHVLKAALSDQIARGGVHSHASLHGARTGLYQGFDDTRGIDIHVGIGSNPSEATAQRAAQIVATAQSYGLHAIINGNFIINDSYEPLTPRLREDGTPAHRSFAAKNPATTRAHVQTIAELQEREIATMQVELSGFLRLQPNDYEPRDRVARAMGVYLGYKVMQEVFSE